MFRSIPAYFDTRPWFESGSCRYAGGSLRGDDNRTVSSDDSDTYRRDDLISSSEGSLERTDFLISKLRELNVERPEQAAKTIIRRFGSIAAFTQSDPAEICAVLDNENVASIVLTTRALIDAGLGECLTRSTVDPNDPTLWRYLSRKLGHLRREVLVALFCDDRGGFLTEEVLACGSRGSVIVPARLLIQRALAVDARSFLLVHNHPSGDPRPSIQDEQQTVSIRALAQQLELRMLGHLIVAGNRVARVGAQEA